MARFRVRRRKNVNIVRVGAKIVLTVLGLYVAGTLLTEVGDVMNATCSPFYNGLSLIGWNVGTGTAGTTGCVGDANTIIATNGSGILAVIGIMAIASIIFEFVSIKGF